MRVASGPVFDATWQHRPFSSAAFLVLLGPAKCEQGRGGLGDEGRDGRSIGQQDAQDFCSAGIANHQPDYFRWSPKQQTQASKVVVLGGDNQSLIGCKRPDLLIALSLETSITHVNASWKLDGKRVGQPWTQIFIQ